MPTPFTHLEITQRLLEDPHIPAHMRSMLNAALPAYLLGGIAADARVGSGAKRFTTHFYDYTEAIPEPPWRVMVRLNPDLLRPADAAHRAFIAAYVAHLSVDEVWSLRVVRPHFAGRHWASREERFFMLHIILTHQDERDLTRLQHWVADNLRVAHPQGWLAFISDDDLVRWRDLIHAQISPGGESQTLQIFSKRIGSSVAEMRDLLDSPQAMRQRLWQYIPHDFLAKVEAEYYRYARDQLIAYLRECDLV